MFKYLLALFSLRILFKFIFFVIGIFIVYALYLFVVNGSDIGEFKNYITNAFNDAIEWLSKVLTFHIDNKPQPDALLNIKNSVEFIAYNVKDILC